MINWNTSKREEKLIQSIAHRAMGLFPTLTFLDTCMSLTACHVNGCPLRLKELQSADDLDFMHDIAGIIRHLNHETGQLEDHFLPRSAK